MPEISDLLRKRNPNVRGLPLLLFQRFCQDHDLSSEEVTNSELQNIVREKLKSSDIVKHFLVTCETFLLTYLIKIG